MADLIHRPNLADEIAELKRRLAVLERTARLPYSSMKGGSLEVLDDSGVTIARIGQISGGATGIEVGLNPNGLSGNTWLSIDPIDGFTYPWIPHPWRRANDFVVITSGTFEAAWDLRVELVSSIDCRTSITVTADVGTAGEVRLRETGSGEVTDTVACPAGQTDVSFNWRSGLAPGGGPSVFVVEARRTAGAGNVSVYAPTSLTFGKTGGTATGL